MKKMQRYSLLKNASFCFLAAIFLVSLSGIAWAGGGQAQSQGGSSGVDDMSERFTYSYTLVNGAGTSATSAPLKNTIGPSAPIAV